MTTEEAIKAIECNRPTSGYTILCEALDMAIAALRAQQEAEKNEPTDPCDLCVYSPPSSLDGKPCCFCPAAGKCE